MPMNTSVNRLIQPESWYAVLDFQFKYFLPASVLLVVWCGTHLLVRGAECIWTSLWLLLQAVCCSDYIHCCPNGYKCVASGGCIRPIHSMSWTAVAVSSMERELSGDVVCPGGKDKCADGQTCCLLDSGTYGCCPYSRVVHDFSSFLSKHMLICSCFDKSC